MKISSKLYDILKWIVLVFLPALVAFIGLLGGHFNWAQTETVVTVLSGFTAFVGALIGTSSLHYHRTKREEE